MTAGRMNLLGVGYRVVAGWGRLSYVSLSLHTHIRTLFVHPRCIHISAEGLCIVQSLSGGDLGLNRLAKPHSNMEVAIQWG